ncbi:MAG: hypothetical protein V8Q42_09515 [Anaerovoracaceae bacterium]
MKPTSCSTTVRKKHQILDIYSQDYVVIEGHAEANCPSIATGITTEQVERQKKI